MPKPRFSLAALLLAITWFAILASFVARRFVPPLYAGRTDDIAGATYYHYGPDWEVTIDRETVNRAPAWQPTEPNPPISARQALAAADRYRRERLIDANNWQWSLDSLILLPADGANGKWCWKIHFTAMPVTGDFGGQPPSMECFVLMDGEVIEPAGNRDRWQIDAGIVKPKPEDEAKRDVADE